ncbi:MAG: hypothetical protein MJ252_10750 [archaeon]|nr:hypothetical protein [archaeon]
MNQKIEEVIMIFYFKVLRSFFLFVIVLSLCSFLFSLAYSMFLDEIFSPIQELSDKLYDFIWNIPFQIEGGQKAEDIAKQNDKELQKISSNNGEIKDIIQLIRFLNNVLNIKQGMKMGSASIDLKLMDDILYEIEVPYVKIKYLYFMVNLSYEKKLFKDCCERIESSKIVELITYETEKITDTDENLKIELMNTIAKLRYMNEYIDVNQVFPKNSNSNQKLLFELIIMKQKLLFIYAICLMELVQVQYNSYKKRRKNRHDRVHLQKEDIKKCNKALMAMKECLEINQEFEINKVKIIMLLVFSARTYLRLEKSKGNELVSPEAGLCIKQALLSLFELNDKFKQNEEIKNLHPTIMLLLNESLFEIILFHISKLVELKIQCNALKHRNSVYRESVHIVPIGKKKYYPAWDFLQCLNISHFKTDLIQSKSCSHLRKIFARENSNQEEIPLLYKIFTRSSVKTSSKCMGLIFSESFLKKVKETKIEFSEAIVNYMKKSLKEDENALCVSFKNDSDETDADKKWKFENYCKSTIHDMRKDFLKNYFDRAKCISSMERALCAICKSELISSYNDNYIMMFCQSKDFKSKVHLDYIRDDLNDNNFSVFIFMFDKDKCVLKFLDNDRNVDKLTGIKNAVNFIQKLHEGALIFPINFDCIKFIFQNISTSFRPKNVFHFRDDLRKYVLLNDERTDTFFNNLIEAEKNE